MNRTYRVVHVNVTCLFKAIHSITMYPFPLLLSPEQQLSSINFYFARLCYFLSYCNSWPQPSATVTSLEVLPRSSAEIIYRDHPWKECFLPHDRTLRWHPCFSSQPCAQRLQVSAPQHPLLASEAIRYIAWQYVSVLELNWSPFHSAEFVLINERKLNYRYRNFV